MLTKLSPQATKRTGKVAAVIVAAALALTGCSGGDDTTGETTETTLTRSVEGAELTVTYVADGDKVTKQTTKNVVNYEASGIADRAAAEESVAPLAEQYKGIKGVEHSIDFGDDELTETVTLTYADLDLEKLASVTGGDPGENPEEARDVSLKEAVKTLTDSGFTEVK
ncbi:DUF1307 domain-containing protein [Leucobacter aridicollis]|uniref:DUF1307 domain-containing protein n=1 Tax=Leucobacter aridicollis TaxID=283878 RepID=UPI0013C514B8|nr:DUF1307 domain-containing protein [Leucobacter aridicollis]UTX52451.1 YehR family protein [Leucobacter aridicollis]